MRENARNSPSSISERFPWWLALVLLCLPRCTAQGTSKEVNSVHALLLQSNEMLLRDTYDREVKIALSHTFSWLNFSSLHLRSCFLKEPVQDSREWCRVLGTLEGPEDKLSPGHTSWTRHPTCCCVVWGTKCSAVSGILQQGSVCPHVQTRLQLLKPIHWVAENTRKIPAKEIRLSELYLRAEYCFLSVAERHWWTLLSAMTLRLFGRYPVPLEEYQFILQVQFSSENMHFIDLTQDNYVIR